MPAFVKPVLYGLAGALILEAFRPAGPLLADGSRGPSPVKANLPLIGQVPTLYTPGA